MEYQDLQEQIAAQKEDLESDMTELVAMQDDMKKKQANVSSLINTTKANLAQTPGRSGGCAVQRRGPGG